MSKRRLTQEEIADALESNRLGGIHQQAIKEREAVLDDIAAYLKETKRKRPAPTMAYQYIGFRDSKFRQMVAAFEDAQEHEDRTEHDWLHRNETKPESCCYCKANATLREYVNADDGGGSETVTSPIGTTFTWQEMEALLSEHHRGEHSRAIYDDCPLCGEERDAA